MGKEKTYNNPNEASYKIPENVENFLNNTIFYLKQPSKQCSELLQKSQNKFYSEKELPISERKRYDKFEISFQDIYNYFVKNPNSVGGIFFYDDRPYNLLIRDSRFIKERTYVINNILINLKKYINDKTNYVIYIPRNEKNANLDANQNLLPLQKKEEDAKPNNNQYPLSTKNEENKNQLGIISKFLQILGATKL